MRKAVEVSARNGPTVQGSEAMAYEMPYRAIVRAEPAGRDVVCKYRTSLTEGLAA